MGTEKRERQKAGRAARIEAERAAEAKQRRNRSLRNGAILVAVILVVLLVSSLVSCSKKSNGSSEPKADARGCPPTSGVTTPKLDFTKAPPNCLDAGKTYTAVFKTNVGTVRVALDAKKAPKTVNNFVFLARWGYYDGNKVFRAEKASGIIQSGSPHTKSNADTGPGYTIPDEGKPWPSSAYGPGTLAMANTGQPNSGSAQFFFLATEGGRYLGDATKVGATAGSYTVFGKASSGLSVLQKIANLDNGQSQPSKPVTIETVRIVES